MKGPELEIEFSAYYNEKKEKVDEGGLYPFLEYCQQSKPKDVTVRIDYDWLFEEIDVYCESLVISNLSYEKIDDSNFVAKFTCDSKSGKPIMKVIYGLGKAGNGGHSYSFSVGEKKFYFDGDGADRIMKINGVKFTSIKNTYDLGKVWNDTTRKDNEENNNENMAKNVIRINEAQLRKLIKESVIRVINEEFNDPITQEAMKIWDEHKDEIDWSIDDDSFFPPMNGDSRPAVGGFETDDDWSFEAEGYAYVKDGYFGDVDVDRVEFVSPDGQKGSFRP